MLPQISLQMYYKPFCQYLRVCYDPIEICLKLCYYGFMTDDSAVVNKVETPAVVDFPGPVKVQEKADSKERKMPSGNGNHRSVMCHFRLRKSENDALKEHIHYAFLSEQIPRETFTDYIMFCLNAGHEKLDRIYHNRLS
jgi:hypothetical protein